MPYCCVGSLCKHFVSVLCYQSLCWYVKKVSKRSKVVKRTHTGGLFATVDMKSSSHGGNLVLHVVEMLNNENNDIKEYAVQDVISAGMRINTYCHDCACVIKTKWEKEYCKVCLLDGFHWKSHKCEVDKVRSGPLNSQACEQLWSRLDNLNFCTEYSRAKYRFFLKEYFKWRNSLIRSTLNNDVSPLLSRRKLQRHG